MKRGKTQKKLMAFAACAALGILLCGGTVLADTVGTPEPRNQSGSFNFVVEKDKDDDSSQITKVSSHTYAEAVVSTYSNNTDVSYLRLRVRRGSTPVSYFGSVTGSSQNVLMDYYTKENVVQGQTVYLRGRTAPDVRNEKQGKMSGVWTP